MLLLSILGVSEDIICIDYSLTEKFEGGILISFHFFKKKTKQKQ